VGDGGRIGIKKGRIWRGGQIIKWGRWWEREVESSIIYIIRLFAFL